MATKHKISDAPTPGPSHWLHQASSEHKKDRATEPDAMDLDFSHSTDTEQNDSDSAGEVYEDTKALADADYEVCLHWPCWFIN
jgi:hypothetical protein